MATTNQAQTPTKKPLLVSLNKRSWLIYIVLCLNLIITIFLLLRDTIFAPGLSNPYIPPNADDQVRVLQAELDAIQKYHGDVLTTLWGALAAISTVLVVATVFGAIQSSNVYKGAQKICPKAGNKSSYRKPRNSRGSNNNLR